MVPKALPSLSAIFVVLPLLGEARAQIVLPSQPHESLEVELYSLRDQVTLYLGDPQDLLRLRYRPDDVEPRVEYASQEQAVLRIQDSFLFQQPNSNRSAAPEAQPELPDPQTWEVRISPAGPTKFDLRCEKGEGIFDFTDFLVQSVQIEGDESKFEIEFERSNPIVLDTFRAHVSNGSLKFRGLLDAHARDVVLFAPGSTCQVEIDGHEFAGESNVLIQGPPSSLRLVISRKIGLRVRAPVAMRSRFQAPHMVLSEEACTSRNVSEAACRVQLTFAEEIPRFEVVWK